MAFTRTAAVLKAEVQGVGQLENSTDITGSVLLRFVNDALAETRELLVGAWEDYYTTSANQVLTPGTDSYALPTDFYKLRKIDLALGGGRFAKLRAHDLSGSQFYGPPTAVAGRYRYRMQAGNLVLVPSVTTSDTLTIYYVPLITELVADGDVMTFRVPLEHKLFLQIALFQCLERQELDTSNVERRIASLTQKVIEASADRDASEPFSLDPRGNPGEWYDDAEEGWY